LESLYRDIYDFSMSPHPDDGGADALLEAGEALYGLLTAAVRQLPRDISLTAASTLATIERAGPRRITDLAVSEGVAQPSMTALVTNLERAGLVERRPDPRDQRVVLVALTSAGADYRRARRRAGAEAFARLIGKLPPAEAEAVRAAVPALRHLRALDEQQRGAAPGAGGSAAPASDQPG
jgi:DNA-binding MarR family transcriptional regulator